MAVHTTALLLRQFDMMFITLLSTRHRQCHGNDFCEMKFKKITVVTTTTILLDSNKSCQMLFCYYTSTKLGNHHHSDIDLYENVNHATLSLRVISDRVQVTEFVSVCVKLLSMFLHLQSALPL